MSILPLLFAIPAVILIALIILFLKGEGNPLPKIIGATIVVILLGSLLVPFLDDADVSEAEYDDYIEIESDDTVSGAFEIITTSDKTYAHAKSVGSGEIDGKKYYVSKAQLDVYMIMGQSNAAYNYYDVSTAVPVAPPGETYYFGTSSQPNTQTDNGTGMFDAVNIDGSAKIGHLEMPFMSEYNSLTGHKVYTINTGWNAANIALLTVGGSHYSYEQRTARNGFDAIDQSHYVISTIGYLWLQGESDAGLDTPVDEYKSDFLKLYNAIAGKSSDLFTTRFTMDKAFIVQTRTARGPNTAEALTELAEENPDIYMATEITLTFSVDDGTLRTDDLHYTQRGFNQIGVAVAQYIVSNELY